MATHPISKPIEKPAGRSISVEEYLSTIYEPDCEYEDGVIVERNLGEFEHSYLQTILATVFTVNTDNWGVYALTEQRVQITPRKFLIPDVCVLRIGDPADNILTHPPLIAIEIQSPDDTIRRAALKISAYLRFGVKHVWVIEPTLRVAYQGTESGLQLVASGELIVPGSEIVIHVPELFEKLDRIRALGQKQQ